MSQEVFVVLGDNAITYVLATRAQAEALTAKLRRSYGYVNWLIVAAPFIDIVSEAKDIVRLLRDSPHVRGISLDGKLGD